MGGLAKTARSVLTNPVVAAILTGTAVGLSGLKLPAWLDVSLEAISRLAAPTALAVLGMGLAEYGVRRGWQQSAVICAIKLVLQPLVVWGLAWLLGLPPLETNVVVLLSSLSVGANVYLMSQQFQSMQGPIATSLVASTALAAITTPLLLAIVQASSQ
jgi:predicted permease